MTGINRIRTIGLASTFMAAIAWSNVSEAASDAWEFSVTPYVWGATIRGKSSFEIPKGSGNSVDVKIRPKDYLSSLDGALMLSAEARKGKWGMLTDVIYLDLSANDSKVKTINGPQGQSVPIDAGTGTDVKGLIWQLGGFYNVINTPDVSMDVLAGMRYFRLKATLDWNLTGPLGHLTRSGSTTQHRDLYDGVVGVRGRYNFAGSRWFVPYYFDVGTGSSSLTWQALLGLGYAAGWGDVQLAYRHLYYRQSGNKLLHDFSIGGPTLSATFRF